MRSGWDELPLGQAPLQIIDGDRGKAYPKHGDFSDEGYCLFLSATNVTNSGFDFSECQFISEQKDEELRKGRLVRNDVVLTTRGTLGNTAFYSDGVPYDHVRINSGMVIMRTDATKLHPAFLYGFLRSPGFEKQVEQLRSGVAQPQLPIRDITKIKLPFPPKAVQERIVEVFNAYDDLIENNRRRMALLEEAARQLYREWFVRLRFPGHEHTRINNGVPEGWECRVLADACASLEDGDWIESKDQGGEDFRLLQISNIGVNEFVETENFRYITEQTLKRLNCREILPGHILISRMPKPIGRAWLVREMPWRMITAVDVAIVAPNPDIADPYFLTYFLNSPENLEQCERRAVGATRARVVRRELASLAVLLPPPQLQRLFREAAEALNKQRTSLYRQNERLRAARDLLLPRLISGEIAV